MRYYVFFPLPLVASTQCRWRRRRRVFRRRIGEET